MQGVLSGPLAAQCTRHPKRYQALDSTLWAAGVTITRDVLQPEAETIHIWHIQILTERRKIILGFITRMN